MLEKGERAFSLACFVTSLHSNNVNGGVLPRQAYFDMGKLNDNKKQTQRVVSVEPKNSN